MAGGRVGENPAFIGDAHEYNSFDIGMYAALADWGTDLFIM